MDTKEITQSTTEQDSVNDEQIAHLAGFFDAAGNISLRVTKDEDYRLGFTLRPIVRVLRPNEEDPILGKLMEYADDEAVKYSLTEISHGGGGSSTGFVITDTDSIERFLEPMFEYMVTQYIRANIMLNEILPELEDGQHREKEGFVRLVSIADDIRRESASSKKVKYTEEYFREMWSIPE
jgi:hypothetical protein